ncbi:MAG: S9 family peptidase, partial [Candidatus Aminicenantes bacterium]|nr:S9 family peptidase [Candidatus Aminicenantes bacterium]
MMRRTVIFLSLLLIIASISLADEKRPITFNDLISMGRLGDPQVSPDGKLIAYVVTYYDLKTNSSNSDIWLMPIAGGEPRKLTNSPRGDSQPRWSPDGSQIAFTSTRTGRPQVWLIRLEGGEARQLTDLSTGASGAIWSPDGKWLLFASRVYPDCPDDECNKKREQEKADSKVKARIIDQLLYRHWDSWTDEKRDHLFLIPASGGEPKDLTPGDYDVPPIALGSAQDYAFSPDGKEICFVMNTDEVVTLSTNNDLFTIPVTGGEPQRITTREANDNQPVYSPDGKYIAYLAMARPKFEADRYRLILYERATTRHINLTEDLDRSVDTIVWSPDSSSLYFTCGDEAYISIYTVSVKGGGVRKLIGESYNGDLRVTPDGKGLVFSRQSIRHPTDIYYADTEGKMLKQLTNINGSLLEELEMNPLETFWFKSYDGLKVQGLMVKPPGFDATKKYPLMFLIHGGPQSAWGDDFHYRWNAQMFAAPGYVVVMINFRGSSNYGQEFTDRISGDWGGGCYRDLMKGLDYALENYPFIDPDKLGASGASYGGYMIYWIAGHTDRFKALFSHDGVYNLTSMYGVTEELWFPEWEFRGTPWTNKTMYEQWSPHNFAQNYKTPMLIVHGEQDFRVPIGEGLQAFTALQRQGIPSRLLYFPDEGHW